MIAETKAQEARRGLELKAEYQNLIAGIWLKTVTPEFAIAWALRLSPEDQALLIAAVSEGKEG